MDSARAPGSPAARSEIRSLGLLFGLTYFVQGIAEPTEGLIAQPVRALLKSWGHSAGEIAAFAAILTAPWVLKPVYGLVSDFLPIAGSRRRSYLVLSSGATAAGLALLYAMPPERGSVGVLLALLLVPTLGVAFADVVVDALMVEQGQPRGITGQLQSVQWSAIYLATIGTGITGGFLAANGRSDLGFLVCAAFAALGCAVALRFVREPEAGADRGPSAREAVSLLAAALGSRAVIGAALFLFLWTFNPFSSAVLYVHLTRELGLGEEFYGATVSFGAAASIAASVSYGFYCRRVSLRALVHASIALGVASTLVWWAVEGRTSAAVASVAVGFTTMTATMIQLDLAARLCPARVAGTVFALLMAVSNLGLAASTALGGQLYDRWLEQWSATLAFQVLVGVGAACTTLCWLVVPLLAPELRRESPASGQPHREQRPPEL
jgi:MFS family permease